MTDGIKNKPVAVATKPTAAFRRYRGDAFEAIHSAASGLSAIGAIDKQTMREFDASCLLDPDLKASDVRRIRRSVQGVRKCLRAISERPSRQCRSGRQQQIRPILLRSV